jgi:hypothetical protein
MTKSSKSSDKLPNRGNKYARQLAKSLAEKFANERIPYSLDRGRDVVYIRKEVQTVRIIFAKKTTCHTCDNGGIGRVRKLGKYWYCDSCLESLLKNFILYEL